MPARSLDDGGAHHQTGQRNANGRAAANFHGPGRRLVQGPLIHFREAASCGIEFTHVSGMDLDRNFPTNFGSGVAIFDYDGDGWQDVYLATTNSLSPHPGPTREAIDSIETAAIGRLKT